jgi:hypothetical protein
MGSGAVGAARSARIAVNKSAPAGTGSLEREIMLEIVAKPLGCSIDPETPKGCGARGTTASYVPRHLILFLFYPPSLPRSRTGAWFEVRSYRKQQIETAEAKLATTTKPRRVLSWLVKQHV